MSTITNLLDKLVSKLPKPIAGAIKAVIAGTAALVAVSLATGVFDWKGIASAAVSALLTYLFPNHPAPKPAAPPVAKA